MNLGNPYDASIAPLPGKGRWLSDVAKRRVKLLAWSLVVLLIGAVLLVAVMRMRGPTPEQQAALEVLRVPLPPLQGKDGAVAAWLFDYEVPAKDWPSAFRALRRYHFSYFELADGDQDNREADRLPHPLRVYPQRRRPGPDSDGLCAEPRSSCLAAVRRDPARTDALLREHASTLKASLDLAGYDGFRYRETQLPMVSLPSFGGARELVRTHFAAQFARGDHHAALAALCADTRTWRRNAESADTLIGAMVFSTYVANDLLLMGEILAEMPASESLPAVCVHALAPVRASESSLCEAMRGEFDFQVESRAFIRAMASKRGIAEQFVVGTIDDDGMSAKLAPSYARYCGSAIRKLQIEDRSVNELPASSVSCDGPEFVGDPAGCVLVGLTNVDLFQKYANRRTDALAKLALMRTVVWLRTQPPDTASWPALLPKRPASLGLKREPKISADGARISIVLLDQSRDEEFSLPLRPSTQTGAPSPASPPDGD